MRPDELKRCRLALGYSVAILSKILSIPPKKLERWEAGTEAVEDPESIRLAFSALFKAHRIECAPATLTASGRV